MKVERAMIDHVIISGGDVGSKGGDNVASVVEFQAIRT